MSHILAQGKYDFLLLQEVDEKVMALIEAAHHAYAVLCPFDEELGEKTQVAVVYKKHYSLHETVFLSFATLSPKLPLRGRGFVGGNFLVDGKKMFFGSAHLHPGFKPKRRRQQLAQIKENIISQAPADLSVFGGDFNTGLPGEILKGELLLGPEFLRITGKL